MNEIIEKLHAFVRSKLLQSNVSLANDTPLIEQGILTSLQAVELAGYISDELGVEIEPEDMNEEDFRSLASIAALILRKRAA